ncbi:hypothetical protein [Streptomyces sp. C10-9-1]|uniref:hypothetical protein n=1 Tax=Streptomyces sp. C10-9-1 TaxID=1859285 RepID=UPI003D73A951
MNRFTKTAVAAAASGAVVFGGSSVALAQGSDDSVQVHRLGSAETTSAKDLVQTSSVDEESPRLAVAEAEEPRVNVATSGDLASVALAQGSDDSVQVHRLGSAETTSAKDLVQTSSVDEESPRLAVAEAEEPRVNIATSGDLASVALAQGSDDTVQVHRLGSVETTSAKDLVQTSSVDEESPRLAVAQADRILV